MSEYEVTVQVSDLDDIRTTLAAVAQYLQAEDIAQAQRKLNSKVEYSALTREVVRVTERIEHVLKDHLLDQHDEADAGLNDQDDEALD